MRYQLTDADLEIVRLSLELARKRASLPDDQLILLDSPKFNGPIGQLDEGDDAATPIKAVQASDDSAVVAQDQDNKP